MANRMKQSDSSVRMGCLSENSILIWVFMFDMDRPGKDFCCNVQYTPLYKHVPLNIFLFKSVQKTYAAACRTGGMIWLRTCCKRKSYRKTGSSSSP